MTNALSNLKIVVGKLNILTFLKDLDPDLHSEYGFRRPSNTNLIRTRTLLQGSIIDILLKRKWKSSGDSGILHEIVHNYLTSYNKTVLQIR